MLQQISLIITKNNADSCSMLQMVPGINKKGMALFSLFSLNNLEIAT